ncbi:MAG TPA: hypothetical protein VIF09_19595 [Polyangiaceae bacterium]
MIRPACHAVALAASFSLLSLPSSAGADEPPAAHLEWNVPPGCPARETVLADVARILHGPPSRRGEARADVTELAPDRWSVHLVTRVDGTGGERSFEADSCVAIASATALIVAWTIDPIRASQSPSTPGTSSVPSPLPPAPAPPPLPPPRPLTLSAPRRDVVLPTTPSSSRTTVSGVMAVGAQADLGTLPSAALSGVLSAGIDVGRVHVEASGTAWMSQDATRAGTEGAHLHLLETALLGCWRGVLRPDLEVDPCGGAALAHLTSDGFGETTPESASTWWGSAQAEVLARWRVAGPLALRASASASVPFSRPYVVILDTLSGTYDLHRPGVVAGRANLGVEAHFP